MGRPHPWRRDAERPQDIWDAVTWHLLDFLEPDEEAAKMVSEITRTYFGHNEAAVDEALSFRSTYRRAQISRARSATSALSLETVTLSLWGFSSEHVRRITDIGVPAAVDGDGSTRSLSSDGAVRTAAPGSYSAWRPGAGDFVGRS
jgi:hypothetical protein